MTEALNYAHQKNLFDPNLARKVVVIGAGSVGSWLVEFLARMGVSNIEVWDGDYVNSYNLPMSRYLPSHIGRYKVLCLAELMAELGVSITMHPTMYTGGTEFGRCVVISCVDTMEARKLIWERVKKDRMRVELFCDTRLAETYVEAIAINPLSALDVKRYEAYLFPDDDAVRQTCGRHGIVYASTRVAGIIAATLASFWEEGIKEWLVRERCDIFEPAGKKHHTNEALT